MTTLLQPLGICLLLASAVYWLLTGTESTLFVLAACLLIVLDKAARAAEALRDRDRAR